MYLILLAVGVYALTRTVDAVQKDVAQLDAATAPEAQRTETPNADDNGGGGLPPIPIPSADPVSLTIAVVSVAAWANARGKDWHNQTVEQLHENRARYVAYIEQQPNWRMHTHPKNLIREIDRELATR